MNFDNTPLNRKRIIVDASCLGSQWSGVAYYTANALSPVVDCLPDTEFRIFIGHSWADRIPDVRTGDGPTKKARRDNFLKNVGRRIPGLVPAAHYTRGLIFSRQIAGMNPDLIIATNFVPPVPSPPKTPVLPFIYDVSFLRMPSAHPKSRVRWLNRVGAVAARAPAIVTISDFSKREILDTMSVTAENIFVAPPGVNEHFCPSTSTDRREALSRHDLNEGRYFLAIGTLEPRKNLQTLIDAYAQLPEALREKYALAIGGGAGWGDPGLSTDVASRLQRAGQLRLLGYVSNEDLPLLYAGSAAFCFPSLYEGFGMPVTEAMACGAAVLASNASSIPEAAGDTGVLMEPLDVEAWTKNLARICEDQDFTQSLKAAGPIWASKFTWKRTAEVIAEAMEYALRV